MSLWISNNFWLKNFELHNPLLFLPFIFKILGKSKKKGIKNKAGGVYLLYNKSPLYVKIKYKLYYL